ncbi:MULTISPECIES: hypothetical protein [Bradyrhizobium]|uniref:Uncharacterized protein n=1 Tax=Bradyrhizobium arachidis TaxID=858423 RepID=A0AAE7NMZ6_9BRAD|nr:hypothetical protein [Bradyrhizobium arachidis]QOZ66390.1 hypothetical protein WN72_08215 [Bradyrhizobium arachidis]SFV18321.1 hypothetical protein SAMN05192541_13438 [Bradyrhizobium arachidis]
MLPETIAAFGTAWSDAEFDRLTRLYAETGGDIRVIAAAMGRSISSISTKSSIMGLAVEGNDLAMRKCLGGCGRTFMSPDKGVRICPRCKGDPRLPWGVY